MNQNYFYIVQFYSSAYNNHFYRLSFLLQVLNVKDFMLHFINHTTRVTTGFRKKKQTNCATTPLKNANLV